MAAAPVAGRFALVKLLSPVDSMFVRMETSRAPLHIGCGAIFELPEGAGPGFVRDLHQAFAQLDWVPFPYDSVVDHGPANALSRWVKAKPDPSYHVRLSALPSPGNDAQLGQLIERLHSHPPEPHPRGELRGQAAQSGRQHVRPDGDLACSAAHRLRRDLRAPRGRWAGVRP